jgi:hypothetical protein
MTLIIHAPATGADTAQNVVYQYLFAGDHRQRTTAR